MDYNKYTEEQKEIACHFAFSWNPLGNPEIFKKIQNNILKYLNKEENTLDNIEIEMIKEYIRISKKQNYETV